MQLTLHQVLTDSPPILTNQIFNKIKQRSQYYYISKINTALNEGNRKVILQTGFTFAQKLYLK